MQGTPDRVRPPRCQITYDVDTGATKKKVELPFVVGVLAELSGHHKESPDRLKDRVFVLIDRHNFDDVLKNIAPRLVLRVPDRLTGQNISHSTHDWPGDGHVQPRRQRPGTARWARRSSPARRNASRSPTSFSTANVGTPAANSLRRRSPRMGRRKTRSSAGLSRAFCLAGEIM